jgi:hypothetical protein
MNQDVTIGIDPGLDGAIAIIDGRTDVRPSELFKETGRAIVIHDVPAFAAKTGRSYDIQAMLGILRPYDGEGARVFLEKVHSMPDQGVASSFTFGVGFGIWQGILAALGMQHTLVTPQRWKKVCLADVAKNNDAAEAAHAARLYPAASALIRGPRGGLKTGRVDALLIAHYGVVTSA